MPAPERVVAGRQDALGRAVAQEHRALGELEVRLDQLARGDGLAQLVRELGQRLGLGERAERDVAVDAPHAVHAGAQERDRAVIAEDDAVLTRCETHGLEPVARHGRDDAGGRRERQRLGVEALDVVAAPEAVVARTEGALGLAVADEDGALVEAQVYMHHDNLSLSEWR